MADDGSGPDWLGLLKWSLAQTDGTSETESRPMGQEDVSFLTKVMEELVADEPKRLKDMMMEIASFLGELSAGKEGKNIADMPREEQQEHMEDLFEELKDITCQLDMAVFFATKLGGVSCILDVLENKKGLASDQVRGCAASALGCLSQNNAEVQSSMFKKGEISRLMTIAMALTTSTDIGSGVIPGPETTQIEKTALLSKVIYAVASSVVSHTLAEEVLLRGQYGADLIKAVLALSLPAEDETFQAATGKPHLATGGRSAIVQLKRRVLSLCRALLTSDAASAERRALLLQAVLPVVFKELSADDGDLREAAVGLVLDILKLRSGEGRREVEMGGHTDSLNAILEARQEALPVLLASADPYDRDAIASEIGQIEEAVTVLSTPIPEQEETTKSDGDTGETAAPTVLMLGP